MSIRTRVLLLLLALTLIPALLTASLDTHLLRSLSADLTVRNASAMTDQALITLKRIADEYADVLDRESRRIRILTHLQADYAERLLQEMDREPASDADVFFAEDFDRADPRLALTTAPAPRRYSDDGEVTPFPVSWTQQVFHHAPGAIGNKRAPVVHALSGMSRFYEQVREPDDPVLRWQYVVLENGFSATYPGHGAYPPDFDPRSRPWYRTQRENPGFRWYRPHHDATTRALVINATMPLFDAERRFIGITGIDVDLTATFDTLELPAYLREGSELMQVAALNPPLASPPRVVVLARQRAIAGNSNWQTLPDLASFSLDHGDVTETLHKAMLAGQDGDLRTEVDGREVLVLYRHFGDSTTYLVMIVPVARATLAAREAHHYAQALTADHVATLISIMLAVSALVILVAMATARALTEPISELKQMVERLADGDFSARTTLTSGDELQALGDAFNTMVPRLKDHARVQESLQLAREVQQRLLPPAPPLVPGYDIAGLSLYSEQTGGDYFDYLLAHTANATRCGVVVGDVSGHGIGPALLMATTRALLHGGRGRGFAPGELLGYVNRELADDVGQGHFVTLFLLGLDTHSDSLEWACAGHDPALYFDAASGHIRDLQSEDIPLGIDADWRYGTHCGAAMSVDDIVVIATDGLWEAANERSERFGKQRLRDYICAHATADASSLCSGLLKTLATFRGARAQHDDVTLVVIKRVAEPHAPVLPA